MSPTFYGFRGNECVFKMKFDDGERITAIRVTAKVDGEVPDVVPKVWADVVSGGLGESSVVLRVYSNVARTWHAVAQVKARSLKQTDGK